MSYLIPDDPIIDCMQRTGYAPWFDDDYEDEEDYDREPFAVYDPY